MTSIVIERTSSFIPIISPPNIRKEKKSKYLKINCISVITVVLGKKNKTKQNNIVLKSAGN